MTDDPRSRDGCRFYILDALKSIVLTFCANDRVEELKKILNMMQASFGEANIKNLLVGSLDETRLHKLHLNIFLPFCSFDTGVEDLQNYKVELQYRKDDTPDLRIRSYPEYVRRELTNDEYWVHLARVAELLFDGFEVNIRFGDNIVEIPKIQYGKVFETRDWGAETAESRKEVVQSAPLLQAIWEGHANTCKMLITEFNLDINTAEKSKTENEETTPLAMAVQRGHSSIVKILLDAGAAVDRRSGNLLAKACRKQNLEIVRMLLRHGNFDVSEHEAGTSFLRHAMNSERDSEFPRSQHQAVQSKKNLEAIKASIDLALQFDNVEMLEELAKFNANLNYGDSHKMTPLLRSALEKKIRIFKYLISLDIYSRHEKVDALELLGTAYLEPTPPNFSQAFQCFKEAFVERMKPPILVKPRNTPTPAYGNHTESQSIQELDRIEFDHQALIMEALVIRERILGRHTRTNDSFIIAILSQYIALYKHDKCYELMDYCSSVVDREMLTLSQGFIHLVETLIHDGFKVPARLIVMVLQRAEMQLTSTPEGVPIAFILEDSSLLRMTRALIRFLVENKHLRVEDVKTLKSAVKEIGRRYPDALSILLHEMVSQPIDPRSPISDFRVLEVLMEVGASPNSIDFNTGSVLQSIVASNPHCWEGAEFFNLIRLLVENGALTDSCYYREIVRPEMIVNAQDFRLFSKTDMNLQCLSAMAIHKFFLPYQQLRSERLRDFIEMHKNCMGRVSLYRF